MGHPFIGKEQQNSLKKIALNIVQILNLLKIIFFTPNHTEFNTVGFGTLAFWPSMASEPLENR
jgi:hypothetical protein